jgi:hypothetical protein
MGGHWCLFREVGKVHRQVSVPPAVYSSPKSPLALRDACATCVWVGVGAARQRWTCARQAAKTEPSCLGVGEQTKPT